VLSRASAWVSPVGQRLGITKPALYYHFSSREELVRSILQPLIDRGAQYVAKQEARGDASARELLKGYFDFHYLHRADLLLVITELTTLADLGLIDTMVAWRERLVRMVFGPSSTLTQATRGVIAFGGLQDRCLQFPDAPHDQLRSAVVDGALAAMGLAG
jgi:AcrR family transcriptional regulator